MTHVIHRIRIELGASDRGMAMMAQNEVSRAIRDNLSAELTPVLDGRFPPGIQKRIDRLELDLGALPWRRFREAFLHALISEFRKLPPELTQASPKPSPVSAAIRRTTPGDERSNAVETFLHYVATGFLPWWCPISRWRDQIPSSLIKDEESLTTLRRELPILFAQRPERVLRLLTFPALLDQLVAPAIELQPGSNEFDVAIMGLPEQSARRASLTLWCARDVTRGRSAGIPAVMNIVQLLLDETRPELHAVRRLIESIGTVERANTATATTVAEGKLKPRKEALSEDERETREGLPTESAGLVLLHPFLHRFFENAGFLDRDGGIRKDRNWHAVQSLHFLAHGSLPLDEVTVVLEKTMCGIDLAEPADWPEMSSELPDQANALLRAVISHWTALKDTSPAGLREAFLQRPGLLYLGDLLKLQVESRAQDVLLSRIPWSFEHVALPGTGRLIHVRWPLPF